MPSSFHNGMEGVALVVDRDGVAGALDPGRQILVLEAVRVEQTVDHGRELVDRQADGVDRVHTPMNSMSGSSGRCSRACAVGSPPASGPLSGACRAGRR